MFKFSEELMNDWQKNFPFSRQSSTPPPDITSDLNYLMSHFCLGALPEPYLIFRPINTLICPNHLGQCSGLIKEFEAEVKSHEAVSMTFLTTNPGADWPAVQGYSTVMGGKSWAGLMPTDSYFQMAQKLGDFYCNHLRGSSLRRVETMYFLAKNRPFMQVEAIPFHSANFPDKNLYLNHVINTNLSASPLLKKYSDEVRSTLVNRRVLSVQATGSKENINTLADAIKCIYKSPWLKYICDLIGLDASNEINLSWHPLTMKNASCSSGLLVFSGDSLGKKSLLVMKGGNNFPSLKNLNKILSEI